MRIAIIGCGAICPNHIRAIKQSENEICALCDILPDAARAISERFELGELPIYTDYKEMLDVEKPDVVHICTPHYLHPEMCVEALSRDINVLCEKPIAISYEGIDMIKDALKTTKEQLGVCFQNRYEAPFKRLKELTADGVQSAFGTVVWKRGADYYNSAEWRGTWDFEGGGVMINQAIHTLDLLIQFLGKPETLYATKANHHLQGIIEVEDTCEGMVKFEGGKVANFYTTTAFLGGNMTTIVFTTKNHTITIQDNSVLYVDGSKIEDPTLETKFVGKQVYGNGHDYTIKAFYSAIVDGTAVPVTLESSTYALRLLLAAYESNDKETKI